ncbi:nuclear transport factor 2 family protein [Maribacter sp. 2-571]|uniref:nuclear transport factor 2 family protein n=1 Tax=Maribacter sp. 2-571 TaxID=3417569 RepID=UPI003D333537
MKMTIRTITVFLLGAILNSCADASSVSKDDFEALQSEFIRFKDKQLIVGLSNAFTDAAGQKDKELFKSLWAEDGEWIIGPPIGKTFKGRDSIANAFEHLIGSWEFFVQLNSGYNVDLSADGKTATANFYLNEIARGSNSSNYNLANYQDELIKKDGGWFFKKRNYHVIYLDTTSLRGKSFRKKNND